MNLKETLKNSSTSILKNKKFRYGSTATALTAIFVTIIIVTNIACAALAERTTLSWDLTKNKSFSLTEQSLNFVKTIDKDVEIIILNKESDFSNQNEYFIQANSVLKQYAKISNKIKLSYIDVLKNPTYIQTNFPDENLNTNSIIVRSGNKHKVLTVNDIFDISYSYYGGQNITASKAEQELTSALVYVTSENQIKIAFLTGYGEQNYSSFSELLKKNNYDVIDVSLLTEEIPEDCSAAIIFGPKRDYDSKGTEKVEKFLSGSNKTLIYAASPELNDGLNLSKLVEKYDIKVKPGLVYESDPKKLVSNRNLFEAICDYADSEWLKNLKTPNIPVILPFCKPLEAINEETVSELLEFSKTAGVMPLNADRSFDFKANVSGPIPSCLLSKKESDNVLVIGSFLGLTDQYLAATSLNNSAYFTNLINLLLNKQDSGLIIESKAIENEELGINAMKANTLGLIYAVFVPLLVLIIGILVFIRRKNK